jgi:hypothetical protein
MCRISAQLLRKAYSAGSLFIMFGRGEEVNHELTKTFLAGGAAFSAIVI